MRCLYLVRHGEARSKLEDPERALSEKGQRSAGKLAAWVAKAGIHVDEICHSGILRAEQTAEALSKSLPSAGEPKANSGLDPDDDVRPVAKSLAHDQRTVMLVGHLPFLGRLASQLVLGSPQPSIVDFAPATLVRLVEDEEGWIIDCVARPDLLG